MNTITSNITYTTSITKDQAQKMAKITQITDQLETKTTQQILENAASIGCVIAMQGENIVWCVWLMKFEVWSSQVYERGSLWVNPDYRGHKIASTLVNTIVQQHPDKILLCLTKELPVHAICNNHLWRNGYKWTSVQWTELWKALEANWDTIEKYTVYMNLSAKNLFETLQNT